MALETGDITATSGMAQAIYDQIELNIDPDLGEMSDEEKEPIREGWRKLAHAIAVGVVDHIQSNLEVLDSTTEATAVRDATGQTAGTDLGGGPHQHAAGSLSVTLDDLIFR